jgi:dienelactone hydrolase
MKRLLVSAVAVVLTLPPASAQFVRQEVLGFASTNATTKQTLLGEKAPPVLLGCHLRLAKAGPKQPVVMLMHGAGGVGAHDSGILEWSRVFNEAGYSTCTVDSNSGRGQRVLADGQKDFPYINRLQDAFAALAMLAGHPLVDPENIFIMGFSAGTSSVIYSNVERFQKMYGNAKFAAHISVYGVCGTSYRGDEATLSPLLIVHGTDEDWVPVAPCREYAARLKKAGRPVEMVEYRDAYHGFDSPGAGTVRKLEQVSTSTGCRQKEADDGVLLNVETGKPLGAEDACIVKGVTFGYNPVATKKAHEDVLAFLGRVRK